LNIIEYSIAHDQSHQQICWY